MPGSWRLTRIASWCTQVRDSSLQVTPLSAFASTWLRKDRAAATAWINKGLLPKRTEDRLLKPN